ncbi:hypothetical protein [Flagellimonas meridianipacifica]|uniref:Nudix hydrolase domain-containing protein n=1 Tax=Flagellimonas meridianipacifica TaxID=1080225 RepID=A0A2T0MAC5_9FLAO|nr:hypothetical protein [Allomuricauda pacifica]PRX54415.1 hypothetical protein CLV81_2816 [Allomuricauda pacifica]
MIKELSRLINNYPIESSIIIFFAGIISTFLLEKLLEKVISKYKTNRLKKKLRKSSLKSMNNGDVFALAHGTPFWKAEDVEVLNSKKKLIVVIPEKFKEKFLSNDSNFKFRDSIYFDSEYSMEDSISEMGIPDLRERIERHSNIVAEELLKKQTAGRLVFNGEMLGVFDIRPINVNQEEYRKLKIRTYETDFFTYRVFASIYRELKEQGHAISQVTKREQIIKYKPFLSSFGLCTFVMLYNQTEVVLAKRSLYTTHSENKWHFSMNEAFSQTDFDYNKQPDLFNCHVRGLEEELNINPKISKKTIYFFDVIFSREKFEMGITSLIYLPDFAFEDLEFFYSCAKDGEVETDGLDIIRAGKKEVKRFMKENEMTNGAKLALQLLLARVLNDKMPPYN